MGWPNKQPKETRVVRGTRVVVAIVVVIVVVVVVVIEDDIFAGC
jgi:hypothetical protein